MKHQIYTLVTILVMSIVIAACGESNNLQVTVAAQNTQIAELSGTSQPTQPQQSPTDENQSNEPNPTETNEQASGNTLTGSFPLINGIIVYPIKHIVGDENTFRDGFRKVDLELFVHNKSTSLTSPAQMVSAIRAELIDSNQFTQQCTLYSMRKMIGGVDFPPNFGVPYVLSCPIPNNANVESFRIALNNQEVASFPATPDGIYNEKPSFDDMIGNQLSSEQITIDDIAQIELVSSKIELDSYLEYPNDASIISLNIKNIYGNSISYGIAGVIKHFEIVSDSGIFTRVSAGQNYAFSPEGLPEIPPGSEAIWDFAISTQASENSALLILYGRSPNDPAYNNELMYTLLRLPSP